MKRKRKYDVKRIVVSVFLPREYLENLDLLVKTGRFGSRTEVVEAALEELIVQEGEGRGG
ncbi:MAG: ribbon-helix-helix protein, CopG family [Thermoproteus sp.]|nr:ribbon-helix-helix protein, CopG family [Thermoproteus sp.]